MRRLLPALVLVCALFASASAGPPDSTGGDPVPVPTPTPDAPTPEAGGNLAQAADDGSLAELIVDGVTLIISLF